MYTKQKLHRLVLLTQYNLSIKMRCRKYYRIMHVILHQLFVMFLLLIIPNELEYLYTNFIDFLLCWNVGKLNFIRRVITQSNIDETNKELHVCTIHWYVICIFKFVNLVIQFKLVLLNWQERKSNFSRFVACFPVHSRMIGF